MITELQAESVVIPRTAGDLDGGFINAARFQLIWLFSVCVVLSLSND